MSDTGWTEHEEALWYTCRVAKALFVERQWPEPVPVTFAMQFDRDERVVSWGAYDRYWFGAVGDGTYQKSTTFVGGFGVIGMTLGAATLAGSAMGNSSRKSRARQDATEMWRPRDQGHLFLSTHGFYLDNGQEFLPFPYECVLRADLTAPGSIEFTAAMANGGQANFTIVSYWSEMVFLMWAATCNPHHPRLANLGWLPRDFIDRLLATGLWETSPAAELASGSWQTTEPG